MPHKDPEVRREYIREWKRLNAEQHRWLNKLADAAIHANARAERYGCEGKLTADDVRKCFDSGACCYCGATDELLTVDHKVPLHAGGPNTPANIVPACRPCNISKFRSAEPGLWSREHEKCIDCGTTEKRHAGKGRCQPCWHRNRRAAA